ncbi:MAG: ribokinase [Phycisphaerae bacterium]|nr:ribokinase [Phycisphaerae bacterium]
MTDGEANVLVVGSINMDLVVRVDHMPAPGETTLGGNFRTNPGGKGANQAVAAARLGAKVRMIGSVGQDDFGRALKQNLVGEGVDVEYVRESEESASGTAMILVDRKGENSIIVASGANFDVTPDDVFSREDLFTETDVVLLQLELPLPTVRAAIEVGRRHHVRTILDPAPVQKHFSNELCEVDILTPNVIEAEVLTGHKAAEERVDKLVASQLIARGAKNAVLKLGSRGSMVVSADQHFYRLAPYKVAVRDTTAAGDAFTAALGVSVARGASLRQAAQFANAAGALACTKFGAQAAMPTAYEVKMLMDDQPDVGR